MLLQGAQPATNGTTPLNPAIGARRRAQMQRVAVAAQRAKFAVLGYCTPTAIANGAPNVGALLAATSQAPSNTGGMTPNPPVAGSTVVPLGSTGLPPLPADSSNPLTLAQSIVGAARPGTPCSWPRASGFPVGTPGQSSSWGNADAKAPAAASVVSMQSPLSDWITNNPLTAGLLSLAGLFGLAYAMKGRG